MRGGDDGVSVRDKYFTYRHMLKGASVQTCRVWI